MRRHTGACIGTRSGLKHGFELRQTHAPCSNFQQGAYHRAHHVAEEAVCAYAEYHAVIRFSPNG